MTFLRKIALAATLAAVPTLHAIPVTAIEVNQINGSAGGGSVNYTLGFQFQADQNLLLTDLGLYGAGTNYSSHQVGLWQLTSGGLVLQRSASFAAGAAAPGTVEGNFRYQDVEDITLVAGERYVLAASNHYQYPVDNVGGAYLSSLELNGITYQGGRWGYSSTAGDALSTPGITLNQPGFFWYLSANFHYDDGTAAPAAVPEPTSLALFGLGGALLLALRRRAFRPRKA